MMELSGALVEFRVKNQYSYLGNPYMLLGYMRKSTEKLDTKALISPWQRLGKGTGYQD